MAPAQTIALDATHVLEVCCDEEAYYATLATRLDATHQKIKLPHPKSAKLLHAKRVDETAVLLAFANHEDALAPTYTLLRLELRPTLSVGANHVLHAPREMPQAPPLYSMLVDGPALWVLHDGKCLTRLSLAPDSSSSISLRAHASLLAAVPSSGGLMALLFVRAPESPRLELAPFDSEEAPLRLELAQASPDALDVTSAATMDSYSYDLAGNLQRSTIVFVGTAGGQIHRLHVTFPALPAAPECPPSTCFSVPGVPERMEAVRARFNDVSLMVRCRSAEDGNPAVIFQLAETGEHLCRIDGASDFLVYEDACRDEILLLSSEFEDALAGSMPRHLTTRLQGSALLGPDLPPPMRVSEAASSWRSGFDEAQRKQVATVARGVSRRLLAGLDAAEETRAAIGHRRLLTQSALARLREESGEQVATSSASLLALWSEREGLAPVSPAAPRHLAAAPEQPSAAAATTSSPLELRDVRSRFSRDAWLLLLTVFNVSTQPLRWVSAAFSCAEAELAGHADVLAELGAGSVGRIAVSLDPGGLFGGVTADVAIVLSWAEVGDEENAVEDGPPPKAATWRHASAPTLRFDSAVALRAMAEVAASCEAARGESLLYGSPLGGVQLRRPASAGIGVCLQAELPPPRAAGASCEPADEDVGRRLADVLALDPVPCESHPSAGSRFHSSVGSTRLELRTRRGGSDGDWVEMELHADGPKPELAVLSAARALRDDIPSVTCGLGSVVSLSALQTAMHALSREIAGSIASCDAIVGQLVDDSSRASADTQEHLRRVAQLQAATDEEMSVLHSVALVGSDE